MERERERDNQYRLVRSKIKRETGRDVVTVSLRFHNTRRLNVVLILQITDFLATWGQQKQKQSSDTFIIIKSFLDSVKVCEQF